MFTSMVARADRCDLPCSPASLPLFPRLVHLQTIALQQLFARFDDDHDGHLSVSELSKHLTKYLKGVLSAAEQRQLFASFDLDRNGVVDGAEFAAFCRGGRGQHAEQPAGGGYEHELSAARRAADELELMEEDGGTSSTAVLRIEAVHLLELMRPAASQFDDRCWLYVVLWLEQPASARGDEMSVIGSHIVRTKVGSHFSALLSHAERAYSMHVASCLVAGN